MIKVISDDGIGHNLKVVDEATGQNVAQMLAIEYGGKITIALDKDIHAELALCMLAVEIAPKEINWMTKNPVTQNYEPVAMIEFRDGTRVELPKNGAPVVTKP